MKIPDNIKKIMQKIIDNRYEAYLIGGCCRDHYLLQMPHDYDIFTNARGEELLQIFPNGHVVGGEERQAKILTVMVGDVEVSTFRLNGDRTEIGNTLEDHQKTCDYTINSIACDINGFIDLENNYNNQGVKDIAGNILRFVGEAQERINEDPLRILRGLRFILKYNMMCNDDTLKLLMNHEVDVPKERIRDELIKILSLNLYSGFLRYILRFLPKDMAHTNNLLSGGKWHDEIPYAHFESSFLKISKITSKPLLRFAVLLHDVGKGVTRTEVDGEIHFYEHHKIGADHVKAWMNEHKFSNDDINYVTTFIYNHMHGYAEKEPSKKSYLKLFVALDGAGISIEEYVMHLYGDNQGNHAKPRIKFGDFVKDSVYIKKYYELKFTNEPFKIHDLAISGKDLIEKYGMSAGKELGAFLKEMFDLIQDGELENTKPALHLFVKTKINTAYGKKTFGEKHGK